jgi:hypothetical protein
MPRLTRSLRARFVNALGWAGMLLGVTGLAAAGLEKVSFGHEHLAAGHARHHNHLFLGSHDHPDHPDRPDAEPEHHSGHSEAPAPHDCGDPPQKTATLASPALFQPVSVSVLAAPLADWDCLALPRALPLVVRHAAQPAPPRGPPFSLSVPDSLS